MLADTGYFDVDTLTVLTRCWKTLLPRENYVEEVLAGVPDLYGALISVLTCFTSHADPTIGARRPFLGAHHPHLLPLPHFVPLHLHHRLLGWRLLHLRLHPTRSRRFPGVSFKRLTAASRARADPTCLLQQLHLLARPSYRHLGRAQVLGRLDRTLARRDCLPLRLLGDGLDHHLGSLPSLRHSEFSRIRANLTSFPSPVAHPPPLRPPPPLPLLRRNRPLPLLPHPQPLPRHHHCPQRLSPPSHCRCSRSAPHHGRGTLVGIPRGR